MTEVDLVADLNAEDEDRFGWSTVAEARDRRRIAVGALVVAGNQPARAVVRVVAVDEDGQVRFTVLPGSVAKNRHLLGHAVA